jgi:hypothetical protein
MKSAILFVSIFVLIVKISCESTLDPLNSLGLLDCYNTLQQIIDLDKDDCYQVESQSPLCGWYSMIQSDEYLIEFSMFRDSKCNQNVPAPMINVRTRSAFLQMGHPSLTSYWTGMSSILVYTPELSGVDNHLFAQQLQSFDRRGQSIAQDTPVTYFFDADGLASGFAHTEGCHDTPYATFKWVLAYTPLKPTMGSMQLYTGPQCTGEIMAGFRLLYDDTLITTEIDEYWNGIHSVHLHAGD